MITLNYTISEQEYKDFYYYLGWDSPEKKAYRVRYQLSSLIAYFAVFILLFFITKTLTLSILTLIFVLIMAAILYYYNLYRIKRNLYNYGKKVYNESDKEDAEMIIGESGIMAKSKDSDAHYKWSAFTKKYETNTAYYLHMANNIALLIPKRVFRSTAEKESFERMLAQCLPLQADLPTAGK